MSSRATTAIGIAVLFAGALGGVAALLRYSPTAPVQPPDAQALDESAPTGGEPDAYGATVTRRFEQGDDVRTSETKLARRGDLSRMEWSESGRRFVSILRPDRGVSILVDLDKNVYAEQPIIPTNAGETGALTGEQVEALVAKAGSGATVARERTGEETVDGHVCIVYRSRIEAPGGGVTESTVWEAKDLGGLALRSEMRGPDGAVLVTEMRDIALDPEPSLFEPPAQARRVPNVDAP